MEPDKQDQTKLEGKQKAKISAQSSQIKDLCTKLDQAVAENSQIKEFLNLMALQQAFMTALQATQSGPNKNEQRPTRGKEFLDKHWEPQLSTGMDGNTDPEKSCQYCKDTGHEIQNCPRLAAKNKFLADWQQQQQ